MAYQAQSPRPHRADEKYPEALSSMRLISSHQLLTAIASARGISEIEELKREPDFEDVTKEYLTAMGADLFASKPIPEPTWRTVHSVHASSEFLPETGSRLTSILEMRRNHDPEKLLAKNKSVRHIPSQPKKVAAILCPGHIIRQPIKAQNALQWRRHHAPKVKLVSEIKHQKMEIKPKEGKTNQCPVETDLAKSNVITHALRRQERERRLLLDVPAQRQDQLDRLTRARRRGVSVIVIGAGLAGLSATDKLLGSGFKDVIVLEAQNKLGGRVHSVSLGTPPHGEVDLGVSGITCPGPGNSVYSLASLHGLLEGSVTESTRSPGKILMANGERVAGPVTSLVSAHCHQVDEDAALIYRELTRGAAGDVQLAHRDYLRERERRLVPQLREHMQDNLPGIPEATKALISRSRYRLGDSLGDLATHLLGAHKDMACADSTVLLQGAMRVLLEPLVRRFTKNTLKLKAKVKTVDWTEFTVKNVREGIIPKVKVTCRDGRVFKADHVIVTVPLGFLKQYADTMFVPELPKLKLEAVRNLGFGTVFKMFFLYSKPFWSEVIDFRWPGTSSQDWKLIGHALRIRTHHAIPCVLEVTAVGAEAENASKDELVAEISSILKMHTQRDVPEPVAVRVSQWHKNEFFQGAHPYLSTQSHLKDIESLSSPLVFRERPVVLFAGDATYKHYTCLTHAARASGLREAKRLCDLYNNLYGYENTMS